jgi:hypothetical protein
MAIDNAILGLPHSGKLYKRSTQEFWDRQDAGDCLRYGVTTPSYSAELGRRLLQYVVTVQDNDQVYLAILYLEYSV